MNIAVVGLGFMGSTHLQAWRKVPSARLAAVVSSDERKLSGDLSDVGGNLDRPSEEVDLGEAARYRKVEQVLADPNVEAVDLCVPTHLHAPLTLASLDAGKHVLVEKPMALTVEGCESMVARARERGKVLMVAQVLRFLPEYKTARELARSGDLGAVRAAFFRRKCAAPGWGNWLPDREKSGGGIFDLLIHDVDYCLDLLGRPEAVAARGVEDLARGIDVVEARLDYGDGPVVYVSGGWHHPKSYPFSMEFSIVCEEGTLDYHSGLRPLTLYRRDGSVEEPPVSERDGFEEELETFLRACREGGPPESCRPEDSAVATRMALAMRTSRERSGEPVRI